MENSGLRSHAIDSRVRVAVEGLSRRAFLRRAFYLSGGVALLAACAPTQAPAPAKPTEAPKPAEAPKPTAAPAAPAAAPPPTAAPAAAAKPTEAPKPAAKPAAADEVDTRPFVYAAALDAETLDPHAASDVDYSHNLMRGAAEGLLEYVVKPDGTVDVGPLLAKSWSHENLTVFTFQLNEGVKFQDGTPFNAEAVKFNFERILEIKKVPAGRLPKIAKIEAQGESTVRFTLEGPSTDFLFTMTQMLMVSPKAIRDHVADNDMGQKWAAENIVGTGAFLIESRSKGSEAALARNKDYWRGWQGNHIEKAIVKVVKEPPTRKLMLEKGEAHLAQSIPPTEIDSLKTTPGVVVESDQAPGAHTVIMRFRGPLKDVNVRKAIAYSFDYDGFLKSAFRGQAVPAQGPLYTKHPFHDSSIPPSKQDMAMAKELLAKTEWPKGGFELSIMILPSFFAFHTAEAQLLQDGLKELGITLNILPMPEIAQYYASMEDEAKGADMWAWQASTQTPDFNFQGRRIYFSTSKRPAGVNGGYANPQVDELLLEDQKTADPARRKQIWSELQKTITADQPALFLAVPLQFLTRRDELQGVPLNVFNFVPNWYNAWLKKKS